MSEDDVVVIDENENDKFKFWLNNNFEIIMQGIYGNESQKLQAANLLLNLTEIFPEKPEISTKRSDALSDLYSSKLTYEKEYLRKLTDDFIERIDIVVKKGSIIIEECNKIKSELDLKAAELSTKYQKNVDLVVDEYLKSKQQLISDCELKLRIIRIESLQKNTIDVNKDNRLDSHIQNILNSSNANDLKIEYSQKIHNLHNLMAKRIQDACKRWISALQ